MIGMGFEHLFGAVMVSIITGAIAGSVASQRTIAALIVHVEYLRSHIDRHESTISRAHQRIDEIERRVSQ
jgi:hypothetical protein